MSVFRRRGIESQAIPGIDEPLDRDSDVPPPAGTEDDISAALRQQGGRAGSSKATGPSGAELTGPFDVSQVDEGGLHRIDFGSILVPAVHGMQVRVELDEQQAAVAISIILDDTSLQLQAFAAPRSEGIWDDIRQEIAEGIRGSQGKAREAEGPFGRELRAEVVTPTPSGSTSTQSVRFIGVDGPRWFLRGLVGGQEHAKAGAVEEVFRGVAVRRGDLAAPPREPLPISIPENSGLLSEEPVGDGR